MEISALVRYLNSHPIRYMNILDVTNGNTANGNKMQIYTCSAGNVNQGFSVTTDNRIAWTNHGECLDLTDGSLANGNPVRSHSVLFAAADYLKQRPRCGLARTTTIIRFGLLSKDFDDGTFPIPL